MLLYYDAFHRLVECSRLTASSLVLAATVGREIAALHLVGVADTLGAADQTGVGNITWPSARANGLLSDVCCEPRRKIAVLWRREMRSHKDRSTVFRLDKRRSMHNFQLKDLTLVGDLEPSNCGPSAAGV